MAMSAEHRSKFAALHRWWWRLHLSEKFSSGTKKTTKHRFKDEIKTAYRTAAKMNGHSKHHLHMLRYRYLDGWGWVCIYKTPFFNFKNACCTDDMNGHNDNLSYMRLWCWIKSNTINQFNLSIQLLDTCRYDPIVLTYTYSMNNHLCTST